MFKTEALSPGKPQPLHRDRILVRDYIDYYNGDRMKLK